MVGIVEYLNLSWWQRWLQTSLAEVQCRSQVKDRSVTLSRHFVRNAASLEIEFSIKWAWLLPRWRPPTIRVACQGDNGLELAEKIFEPSSPRTTAVRIRVPYAATRENRRLRFRVSQLTGTGKIGELVFTRLTVDEAAQDFRMVHLRVVARSGGKRIVTDRLHDAISEFGFELVSRLGDGDRRSLIEQSGVEMKVFLRTDARPDWSEELRSKVVQFRCSDWEWSEVLGSPRILLPEVPGNYELRFSLGDTVVATKPFLCCTAGSATTAARTLVKENSQLRTIVVGAIDHRSNKVPLQVVAEDFEAITATVTLEVPEADPLIRETLHSFDLTLGHEGRELLREHCRTALKCGRRRITLALPLSQEAFLSGPGPYRLGVWMDDRLMHSVGLEHRTRAQLRQEQAEAILQSLRVSQARLFCVRDGARLETSDLFITDSAVAPAFCITGDGFDEDAPALQWQLGLHWHHLDSGEEFEEQRTLVARAGSNLCADLELPLHRRDYDCQSGRYRIQLRRRDHVLQEFRFRVLSKSEIVPWTERLVLQSLQAVDMQLIVRSQGIFYPSSFVPDWAEGIMPKFTIQSAGYNRFVTSLKVQLRLILERGGKPQAEIATLWVTLSAKPVVIQNLLIAVRGALMGATSGRVSLSIFLGDRRVAEFPFEVTTRDALLHEVRVSAIDVFCELSGGGGCQLVTRLDIAKHRSLAISLEVEVGIQAPDLEFAACLLLRSEHRPIGQAQFTLRLTGSSFRFNGRAIRVAQLGFEGQPVEKLIIEVFIGGALKGSVCLSVDGLRISNFEGQLIKDAHLLNIEKDEYEKIIRNL